jgi:glycosyltransferase involved in cell wall biosynthesis
MRTPLFSIVTISFQNLDGLRRTVESVQSQSFPDVEHIVIDGGSGDGSGDWLAANFDGTWVSEPDDGRYDAMNKGSRTARGEYLWFMHAGDVFGDPSVLSRVAAAIEQGDQARSGVRPEWLYGLARVVNPDKSLHSTLGIVPFRLFNFALLQRPMPHQATVIRRELFWQLGGYDEDFGIAADQLLMLRAANVSPPMPLADFLCDFDSTGISANRPWLDSYRDGQRLLRHLDAPVTRSRALDNLIAFGFALARHLFQSFRAATLSPNTDASDREVPTGYRKQSA